MLWFSKRLAWFCILLTLLSAFAVVAHHHSSGTDEAKCTVCVTAHAAAPRVASSLARAVLVFVSNPQPELASAKQLLVTFALSVRPPPTE